MSAQTDEQVLLTKPMREQECQYVQRLTLSHFRNYESMRLELDARPVIITGENGAGKTNILEAISFLAPGRGMRKATLQTIDRVVEGRVLAPWTVATNVQTADGEIQIGTGRDMAAESSKRIIKVDGEFIKNQAELAALFTVIWLTPQMDGLFLEGASSRRKFLDRIVYHFDPEHAKRVNRYELAVRERMRLLQIRGDEHWLHVLEQRITENAIAIAAARIETIALIQQTIDTSTTPFPKAQLAVAGWVEEKLAIGSAVQVEAMLAEALRQSRYKDRESGRTNVGTHRSDFQVVHMIKNMPAELCSTGEQKALLLSIVLAEARARAEWRNSVPVLLLDEVVAHLDEGRREALFAEILDMRAQCWMTGTDIALFNGIKERSQCFSVTSGVVS